MIKYLGVTLEKCRYPSSISPSMRMYEIFREGNFRPEVAEEAVTAIARDFNLVRVVVGAGHLNYPEVGPDYVANLKLFFKMCVDNGLWIMPQFWTGGVYPDEVVFSTSDVCHYRWDPIFRTDGAVRYNQAVETLLEISEPFKNNIHHIDLRNEIHGHIAQQDDEEWAAAKDKYGYNWGYIPDHAASFWQDWLLIKYSTLSEINAAWGSNLSRIADIPVFHTWSMADVLASNPKAALTDQRQWVLGEVRGWVYVYSTAIRLAGFQVGQCTGSDSNHMTVAPTALRTSDYITQSAIGDLVDVLDFHAYDANPPAAVAELQTLFPDKEIFHGEIHPDHPKLIEICQSGIEGLVVWSTGCRPGGDASHAVHYWDDWLLTPAGGDFLTAVQPYLDLIYPQAPQPPEREMTFLVQNATITIKGTWEEV